MAMTYRACSVDNPTAPPLEMSARLRSQLVYFMTPPDAPHVPSLQKSDSWIDAQQTARWLEEGILDVPSPLDDEHRTVIELSEEQEAFLEWLATNQIQHIRLQEVPQGAHP